MNAMREAWTDERLDDLNGRVSGIDLRMEEGFKEMRAEFRAVRAEMAAGNRTLAQVGVGMFATSLLGFAVTIATILAQT